MKGVSRKRVYFQFILMFSALTLMRLMAIITSILSAINRNITDVELFASLDSDIGNRYQMMLNVEKWYTPLATQGLVASPTHRSTLPRNIIYIYIKTIGS